MVRMKVLLPLPDGPITTTTSPLFTSRFTPRRAWKLPKCLCTSRIWIMGWPAACVWAAGRGVGRAWVMAVTVHACCPGGAAGGGSGPDRW